jgi:hypothetical protein
MVVEAVLPNGNIIRNNRPFKYAIAVGPADKAKVTSIVLGAIDSHEEDVAQMRLALDRRTVEREHDDAVGTVAFLSGWPNYRLTVDKDWDGSAQTQVQAFLYEDGETDTAEKPVNATVLEVLVNHVRGEISRRLREINWMRADLDKIGSGDPVPLGLWRVFQWCPSERLVEQMLPGIINEFADLGSPVTVLETRQVVA